MLSSESLLIFIAAKTWACLYEGGSSTSHIVSACFGQTVWYASRDCVHILLTNWGLERPQQCWCLSRPYRVGGCFVLTVVCRGEPGMHTCVAQSFSRRQAILANQLKTDNIELKFVFQQSQPCFLC